MNITIKKFIAFLLSFILLLGICIPVLAKEEEPYRYLAIGDSTCSGYNSDEFVYKEMNGLKCGDNPWIYPNLMGNYLRNNLNREVEVNCILPEGIRAHDLRAVLDPEFIGDQYCINHIRQWSDRYGDYDSLHDTFCDAIAKADLISIDVCMSCLGNYFLDRIKCALGIKKDKTYEDYYSNDLLSNYINEHCSPILSAVISCRSKAEAFLKTAGIPVESISKIIDAYEYSVGTLMINFTESVKKIYELNDDIQLIVMSPFATTCYDLTLEIGEVSFSLSSLMNLYLGTVYNYIVKLDPNHNRYKVADMYHTFLRCFPDAIADGEWDRYLYVTEEIRRILLSYGVPVDGNNQNQEKYFREIVCKNVEKAFNDKKFDITMAPFHLIKSLYNNKNNIVNSLIQSATEDYDNASPIEQLALRLILVFESWGCHPDYSGHEQKFEAMRKVYETETPNTEKHSYFTIIKNILDTIISNKNKTKNILKTLNNCCYSFFQKLLV